MAPVWRPAGSRRPRTHAPRQTVRVPVSPETARDATRARDAIHPPRARNPHRRGLEPGPGDECTRRRRRSTRRASSNTNTPGLRTATARHRRCIHLRPNSDAAARRRRVSAHSAPARVMGAPDARVRHASNSAGDSAVAPGRRRRALRCATRTTHNDTNRTTNARLREDAVANGAPTLARHTTTAARACAHANGGPSSLRARHTRRPRHRRAAAFTPRTAHRHKVCTAHKRR